MKDVNENNFLEELINKIDKEILKKFSSLSKDGQIAVVNDFASSINKQIKIEYQRACEETCEKEGHIFGKWNHDTWDTWETYWDAGPRGEVKVTNHAWSRVCKRCGYIEKQDDKPIELINEEREKRRKQKIKRLEKQLEKLKNEEM